MTPEEHISESRDSALTVERLFSENRDLQGAEMAWCSVKHAINAIGVQRGWRYGTYGQKREVVRRLELAGHRHLLQLLDSARLLHVHSDNGFMNTQKITEMRNDVVALRERLLAIAEADA